MSTKRPGPSKTFPDNNRVGTSYAAWYEGLQLPKFRSLSKSAKTEVCIVGAGIAGLTTAYLLSHKKVPVIVLDEGPIGGGETGRTSAHLASVIDDRFVEIEREHGKENCRLAYQSHVAAIDLIERIVCEEKIKCDFARVEGFLSAVPGDKTDFLDRELAAAHRAGFSDAEMIRKGGMYHGRCIRFGHQAKFQPIHYLIGLAQAVTRLGGKIYTGRRVRDAQGADEKTSKAAAVQLAGEVKVSAQHIVVATNTPSPINDWFGIYTKQASYRSYVIAGEIRRGSVGDALYWDTADPYHYVRVQKLPGNRSDLLLIGGEDHKVGQYPADGNPHAKLESWARKNFPKIKRIVYRWSGQIQEPADGLAFIGRALTDKENVYIATGDSGMGLTHGTMAGMIISDLIRGKSNPWAKIYDPSRKILNAEFVRENANTLTQYKDLLTGGDVKSAQQIPKGQGRVIRDGLKKLAVYRDDAGKIQRHSAVCTHLQCIVQWNRTEKSWDCPCHGSRFDPKGKVLIGPAIDDLPAIK